MELNLGLPQQLYGGFQSTYRLMAITHIRYVAQSHEVSAYVELSPNVSGYIGVSFSSEWESAGPREIFPAQIPSAWRLEDRSWTHLGALLDACARLGFPF